LSVTLSQKARLEPTEEAVEASVDGDAERDEGLSWISRALMKIDVIAQCRLAESQ